MTTEFTPEELKAQIAMIEYVINTLKSKLPLPSDMEVNYITPAAFYEQKGWVEQIKLNEIYLETLKSKVTPK